MKTGIIGILNNPSKSINHHSSGAVEIVSRLFKADILTEKDDWDSYDDLIIYHGPNFRPGSFNVIGGINADLLERCFKLYYAKSRVRTLDGFQLNEFARKRNLPEYADYQTIAGTSLPARHHIVVGDSHSLSVWPDDSYTINRMDGKTLYGFLKNPIDISDYRSSILYFGNIDIRFHLCRQADPVQATKDLFSIYCEYAFKHGSTITNLLPIELETRKIPKSGMYKNKPFFGSRKKRAELVEIANEVMNESGLEVIKWPDYFTDNDGVLKNEILEPRQSVHIRPKHYIRNQNQLLL